MKQSKIYVAIDLKSFYASVECVERGLDPLTTNLVVADESRTEKTICLAVSPSLKAYKIPGRARLFEVIQRVKEVNAGKKEGEKVTFMIAQPRMSLYVKYSTRIYRIYLKYVAPEDIHVYSIDEVFLDVTQYLKVYQMSAVELTKKIIQTIYKETKITATAGIGTNMYLCKVALDIVAKYVKPDAEGVRIAELDEMTYRKLLWTHRPLTDFWRIGRGYAKKLEEVGLFTMGDIARCSIGKENEFYNEELLYKLFGVNAELLIDHAWGYESCTIADIKAYKSETTSIGSGQVLQCPYEFEKGRLIVAEMTDLLALDLAKKGLVTDQLVLTVGYDIKNLTDQKIIEKYQGEIVVDHYGRKIPKHAHGTENLKEWTASSKILIDKILLLYDRIVNPDLLIRRVNIAANHVITEKEGVNKQSYKQLTLFQDFSEESKENEQKLEKEKRIQRAMLDVKSKYGKNAILKGMNMQEGAMTIERNKQIGGHKS